LNGNEIEKVIKSDNQKKKSLRAKTGCILMDILVGGGSGEGYPFGRIINIVGDKSSGKTFLALEIIAACYHRYGNRLKWVYDDCESGFSFDTKYLYGFEIMPPDEEDRFRSRRVEDLYNHYREFKDSLEKKEYGIYVVDSLDGLTSREQEKIGTNRFSKYEEGKDFDQGSYKMGKAKFLSQDFFPEAAEWTEEKNILLVIISQTRDKIDSLFKQQTRSGGKAMDFYAHTVLWLSHVRDIETKGRPIGAIVKAFNKKSKTPRPRRSIFFSFLFDLGLDDIGTCVDFLFELWTEKGDISKGKASQIIWEENNPKTLNNLKVWMEEKGILEEYRGESNRRLKLKEIDEFISSKANLKAEFDSSFGEPKTREELISWIEKDSARIKELHSRVREKWESIEDSIKPDRKKKYGTN